MKVLIGVWVVDEGVDWVWMGICKADVVSGWV